LQPIYDKINNLYTDRQRKEDEGRAKKEAAEQARIKK
jgi:hypothetical protein